MSALKGVFRVTNENNLFTGMMKSGNLQWKTAIKGHSTETNQEGRKEKTVLKKKRLKRVVILFLKGVDT